MRTSWFNLFSLPLPNSIHFQFDNCILDVQDLLAQAISYLYKYGFKCSNFDPPIAMHI